MYSKYGRILESMGQAKSFPEFASILNSVLLRCDLPLEHNGPIEVPSINITGGAGLYNYAKATTTWTRASGNGSTVTALPASDPTGTPTGAAAITIVLPRYNKGKDPNVYADDVLIYTTIGSTHYAVGESFLDDKIGTIKYLAHSTIPNGWAKCDGAGSTPDIISKFIRGGNSPGTTGGSDTHSHTGTVTVDAASVTISGTTGSTNLSTGASAGTTGSNTTGVTVADHGDHYHTVQAPCQSPADTGPWTHQTEHTLSSGVVDAGGSPTVLSHSVTDPGHTHSIGSHTHSISPDPHSHGAGTLAGSSHTHTASVSIASGNNVPAYIQEIPIIRVGPSGEIS